jgi:hypothetical protein
MSGRAKKRKNAGKGFGMMFHGMFASKKDAKRKERESGGFMQRKSTPHGTRYLVMSERKNPIKRKKKPKPNPHELLVLGANPSETHHGHQEITVPPGSTITIRMNPTNPDRFTSAHAAAKGITRQAPGLIQTKKQRRIAGLVRVTRRSASKHKYDWIPSEGIAPGQNPSAEAIREDFVGAASEWVTTTNEPHMPAGDYAQLGELLALYVKPRTGGQVQTITFSKPFPLLVSDESARQLFFVDGDQDVTSALTVFGAHDRGAGLFELGEARRIDYKQRKEHVKDPHVDEWRHEFGEETDERPTVLFDRPHKRLLLEGGAYQIRREGIVN